jgi:hypothetical protein
VPRIRRCARFLQQRFLMACSQSLLVQEIRIKESNNG